MKGPSLNPGVYESKSKGDEHIAELTLSVPTTSHIQKGGHKETSGVDGFVYYLDRGDDVMGVMPVSKLIKLYTLNMCSFLYINYTSTKPF